MLELIAITGTILSQTKKLMENPAVGDAVKGVINWVGGVLGKDSARKKLQEIEADQHDEGTIKSIESNLEYVLEGNEALQKELAAKIEELQQIAAREGVPMVTKTNTITITGDGSKAFQDLKVGGDFTYNG